MSEKLILEIFKNWELDFKQYKNSKSGRIAEYFEQNNIKNPKLIKIPNSDHKAFAQKKGKSMFGKAVVEYGRKNYFIGDYKENAKNGFGYHRFKNGLVYRGQYKGDIKVDGTVIDPSTSKIVYEGDWEEDTYHGHGTLTRRNGQFYKGAFEQGKFQGKGKIWWPNGDVYEGDFNKSTRDGYGVFKYANGDFYEGAFLNNKFHGQGKYVWSSGDEYSGEFQYGLITGNGDMNYTIGIIGSGVWNDNRGKQIQYSLNSIPPSLQDIPTYRNNNL